MTKGAKLKIGDIAPALTPPLMCLYIWLAVKFEICGWDEKKTAEATKSTCPGLFYNKTMCHCIVCQSVGSF